MHEKDPFKQVFKRIDRPPFCSNELLLIFGCIILVTVLIVELFDWNYWFPQKIECKVPLESSMRFRYGYEDHNGPRVWREMYGECINQSQSPINIISDCTCVCPSERLIWSLTYGSVPLAVRIKNDGHCVLLQAKYPDKDRPQICGGPIKGTYELFNIRFRWGPCDDEGSEHTIDFKRYAMEMQVLHIKVGCKSGRNLKKTINVKDEPIIIISYLFQATPLDNPYLDPVVNDLRRIEFPGSKHNVRPFPLSWLMPSFSTDYFVYEGSLTHPPCSEGVYWFIQPEPIAASCRQLLIPNAFIAFQLWHLTLANLWKMCLTINKPPLTVALMIVSIFFAVIYGALSMQGFKMLDETMISDIDHNYL